MKFSGCYHCFGLHSALCKRSVLLQDCHSPPPLYANLHFFPRTASAKKHGRNLNTAMRHTQFHCAQPATEADCQEHTRAAACEVHLNADDRVVKDAAASSKSGHYPRQKGVNSKEEPTRSEDAEEVQGKQLMGSHHYVTAAPGTEPTATSIDRRERRGLKEKRCAQCAEEKRAPDLEDEKEWKLVMSSRSN